MKRVSLLFLCLLFILNSLGAHGDGKSLTLNPVEKPVLSLSDFTHATVSGELTKTVLSLTLTDAGSLKLKKFSAAHVGDKLAILVNDQVVAAPLIRAPISGPGLSIDALTRSEAEAIAVLVNSGK